MPIATVETDEDTTYRMDGNSVNIDAENAKLAKNQILYSTLIQQLSRRVQQAEYGDQRREVSVKGGVFYRLWTSAHRPLTAQRMRMDVISENIANAKTTRTDEGGPYRRRVAVMAEKPVTFSSVLGQATGGGVEVTGIVEDMSDFEYEYDPDNPDADASGYVAYPNVDETEEIIDMMSATRSYEANVTALNATKSIAIKALEISRA